MNYVQWIESGSAHIWWRRPSIAERRSPDRKRPPKATMNSNLDAKLVGATQSGNRCAACLFSRGMSSQQFNQTNRQSFVRFHPVGRCGSIPQERSRTTWNLILSVCTDPRKFSSNREKVYPKRILVASYDTGALFWMNPNEAFHSHFGVGSASGKDECSGPALPLP
jgi:hypothetical protein